MGVVMIGCFFMESLLPPPRDKSSEKGGALQHLSKQKHEYLLSIQLPRGGFSPPPAMKIAFKRQKIPLSTPRLLPLASLTGKFG
jgi:hypothetical protein